jgi:hypothetical protein
MSTNQLIKGVAAESNCDVIFGLQRPLVAETINTLCLAHQKILNNL